MPTSRAYTFLIAAALLYLFANQTQVGWLYVMSALLAGTVVAGWFYNRGSLRGIHGTRRINDNLTEDLYEGDDVTIGLAIHKKGSSGAAQLRAIEICPLAAPDSPQRSMLLYIPSLLVNDPVQFDYPVTIDRRGVQEFAPMSISSQMPFGFFIRKGTVTIPTRVLVYPEVRSVRRLDLLDRHFAAQVARPRAGVGYEVMGVRPFRSGDSPRHIHWRTVARTGQLMSKEFADEAQPGLTLVMDVFQHDYAKTDSKHAPFEWAVKVAASIGDYAYKRGYPLYLAADPDALATPSGPVSNSALLQYLARIQPTGQRKLSALLSSQKMQTFVVVIIPWPDETILERLIELNHRSEVLAVVIDPQTFPEAGISAAKLVDQIRGAAIETRLIRYESDWAVQLVEQN